MTHEEATSGVCAHTHTYSREEALSCRQAGVLESSLSLTAHLGAELSCLGMLDKDYCSQRPAVPGLHRLI